MLVTKLLGRNASHNPLHLIDEPVELFITADGERAKSLEKGAQVVNGGVTKDFWGAIVVAGKPFGKMRHQRGQLIQERLLRQLHGFVKTSADPLAFLPVQLGVELP